MTRRPLLLDLFCGAGGAAMGYHRAGFDVVGVDLHPQPRYPFTFVQADAMAVDLTGFDAIHASPPCQAYSSATPDPSVHPDLYAPTRDRLAASGRPYVIENVIGAPYSHGVILCGSMFPELRIAGEWIQRHRNFEASWMLWQLACAHPGTRPVTITGHAFGNATRDVGRHSRQATWEVAQQLMGIDWMTRRELTQAIPPAYTEWLGRQLLAVLR